MELPLVALADELTIALLITVDQVWPSRRGRTRAGGATGARPADIVVSVATMGIPLAIEASRALGLDDYVILHKTPKIHLGDPSSEPVYSITTDTPQRLRMDPARVAAVGRAAGGRRRRRHLHGRVALLAALAWSAGWSRAGRHRDPHDRRRRLARGRWARTPLVRALGSIPLFHPDASRESVCRRLGLHPVKTAGSRALVPEESFLRVRLLAHACQAKMA